MAIFSTSLPVHDGNVLHHTLSQLEIILEYFCKHSMHEHIEDIVDKMLELGYTFEGTKLQKRIALAAMKHLVDTAACPEDFQRLLHSYDMLGESMLQEFDQRQVKRFRVQIIKQMILVRLHYVHSNCVSESSAYIKCCEEAIPFLDTYICFDSVDNLLEQQLVDIKDSLTKAIDSRTSDGLIDILRKNDQVSFRQTFKRFLNAAEDQNLGETMLEEMEKMISCTEVYSTNIRRVERSVIRSAYNDSKDLDSWEHMSRMGNVEFKKVDVKVGNAPFKQMVPNNQLNERNRIHIQQTQLSISDSTGQADIMDCSSSYSSDDDFSEAMYQKDRATNRLHSKKQKTLMSSNAAGRMNGLTDMSLKHTLKDNTLRTHSELLDDAQRSPMRLKGGSPSSTCRRLDQRHVSATRVEFESVNAEEDDFDDESGDSDENRRPLPINMYEKPTALSPLCKQPDHDRVNKKWQAKNAGSDKKRQRKLWTRVEVTSLLEGYEKFGSHWALIKERYSDELKDRSSSDLRVKWRHLRKYLEP